MSDYAGDPFPPLPPGQEPSFFFRQRQSAKAEPTPPELTINTLANTSYLAAVFERLRRQNGTTPGPDGLKYPDLGRRELFAVLRPLSKVIKEGTYRPGPARSVTIPKADGSGFRTLRLRNLLDRVVAKAVQEALVPYWEAVFRDGSHGFRPGRSRLNLLAQLEHSVTSGSGRWVLASDDIKKAFDLVNLERVLDDHRRHRSIQILNLLAAILRGDVDRQVGIDQGSPYSPTALNVHLHHVYDQHAHALGANPGTSMPWLRYADNFVVPCQSVPEGQQVLSQTAEVLKAAGLVLKGENGGQPVDLRTGGRVQLLGFTLFKQKDRLRYKLGPDAWTALERNLLKAHETERPGKTAGRSFRVGSRLRGRPSIASRTVPWNVFSRLLPPRGSEGFTALGTGECQRAWNGWKSLIRTGEQNHLSSH